MMLDLITFATPALMLGILYCLYRAATLFVAWRPAAAVAWGSDYDDAQQADDLWGMGALRGWRLTDTDGTRLIEETVHYQDETGERHIAEIGRYVHRGFRPDDAHVIWYDSADPARATGFGPGIWLATATALAIVTITLLRVAYRLHV